MTARDGAPRQRERGGASLVLLAGAALLVGTIPVSAQEEFLVTTSAPGHYGGRLIVAERSQPKTLNPITAVDNVSRDVIQLMTADLIHSNQESQRTEPALASSYTVSPDGRHFVLHLRHGLRFSDGHPFDADDVVFSFQVYLDEKTHSPQRDLLLVGGKPISVHRQDAYTVAVDLPEPHGPAERMFDDIAILPRHLLLKAFMEGTLPQAWSLGTEASQFAGLGPFRFAEYVPGQRLTLERNPYYWKMDKAHNRLPYLDNVTFHYVGAEDARVLSFQSGSTDIVSRLNARDFQSLAAHAQPSQKLLDIGPGLEYSFLFFNLNDVSKRSLPEVQRKQSWFRDVNFRRAVSVAIDRENIAKLVYAGRATPIWTNVTPGNKLWINASVPKPPRSVETARKLLRSAGFSWNTKGQLLDSGGKPVEFTIVINTGNTERAEMATIIQEDLKEIGISVQTVQLEFRSMLDRVMNTFDYDACILGLTSGDVDPGSEMNVWTSGGSTHLWHLGETAPDTGWEAEIDRLMKAQMVSTDVRQRKILYDRVQQLVADNLPVICLVSPDVLVAAKSGIRNFRPAILPSNALWNAEELFWNQ
jgi:peptide/nickel transport system substrate-binding protein